MIERVDLVLGGGGVRGIAHVGAYAMLAEHGVEVQRVAGASSGALAGAMIAARTAPDDMRTILLELDWGALTLSDLVGRLSSTPVIGGVIDRVAGHRTMDPLEWITELLAERDIHTWADLRMPDPEPWLEEQERYRLVVRCLDVVNRRTVRLPWDYHRYGLDPDEQSVAEAVRASMAVPMVFDPVPIGDPEQGGGLLMDGGLAAGFGVDVLDRRDGQVPMHPTVGLQLAQRAEAERTWPTGELELARAMLLTMLDTGNDMHPVGECDERRTVRLDTAHIRTLDVGITIEEQDELYAVGRDAMARWLDRFDHDDYVLRCRGGDA